ncbi:hypothetical protein [Stenotrophomonas sp.]|uniref:hypothetical protein n=1 Tax=Stenotrophomonas sp. TaxID=69392 RepID=UPI002897D92D|nr:hypothetical protein [Stenotrophomonas sp.]
MRIAALLLSMLATGTAAAAPAQPKEVEKVMQGLGIVHDAPDVARMIQTEVSSWKQRPDSPVKTDDQVECLTKLMLKANVDSIRDGIIEDLGDEGGDVIAAWIQFLDSPAGATMRARAAGASMEEVNAMVLRLDEAEIDKGKAFFESAQSQRLNAVIASNRGFSGSDALAQDMLNSCKIQLPIEKSS